MQAELGIQGRYSPTEVFAFSVAGRNDAEGTAGDR
jgi:hypothetical protein